MKTELDRANAAFGEAKAAFGEAEQVLARWGAEVTAKSAERASLQERAGEEALNDPAAASRLATQLAELAAGVDIAERAVVAASARVAACHVPVLTAQASVFRAGAADLRVQATKRQVRTDRLLAELAEHEGVPFSVAPRPDPSGIVGPAVYPWTVSQSLLGKAKALDQQAAELDLLVERAGISGADVTQARRVSQLVGASS